MNATETNPAALPSLPLCPEQARYTYHVLTAAAQMSGSCRGVYKRVAVVKVDHHEHPAGFVPKTIREGRGVEIVRAWERLSVGKTERCAYQIALRHAATLAINLAAA